jgi:hypothetical protein
MKTAHAGTMPPRLCPAVETLLRYERTIVPHVAIVRARALARARDALRAGERMVVIAPSMPVAGYRFLLGAAASVTLLASAAAAYQWLRPPVRATRAEAPVVVRAAQVQPVPAPAEPTLRAPTKPSAAVAPASADPSGKGAAGTRAVKEDALVDELYVLERAQQSAAHGDYTAVLVATADHERRYPAGRLCEEREALRLRALVGLGREKEARLVAAGFRRAFPHSVFLPKLDDLLASAR